MILAKHSVIIEKRRWEKIEPNVHAAMLATLQESSSLIEAAVKEEAPVKTGNLRDSIYVDRIIPYGPHRFMVAVKVDLERVPYYYAVIRGHPEMVVGQPGKKYSPEKGVLWVGPFKLPARPPNNFPRRAVRRVGPEIINISKRNFVTRVAQ